MFQALGSPNYKDGKRMYTAKLKINVTYTTVEVLTETLDETQYLFPNPHVSPETERRKIT